MTGFEQKGCDLQMDSDTIPQSIQRFRYSCNVCCAKGMRISCDRCAIAYTHENVVAALKSIEDEKRRKKAEVMKGRQVVVFG